MDSGREATYNGKTFLYSSDMTWWTARNWCLAHGKSLVSLSDLGITGGYNNKNGFCYESACAGADWDALTAAFGNREYRTNDSYSSCKAFNVNPTKQGVYANYRASGDADYYALCR